MDRPITEAWTEFLRQPGEETFGPVYEGTKRLVWTLCLRILGDREEAEDAFQSTYCRLLVLARGSGAGKIAAGEPPRLVARLAIREADRLKKRRSRRGARETSIIEEAMKDERSPVLETIARREVRDRIEAIVGRLPERYRLPVQLHYFHGLSVREVARALDQPPSNIAYRLRKALPKLDRDFRQAGLRDAGATLAGLAAGAALFEPSASAATVFARAEAVGSLPGSVVGGATAGASGLAILGGILSMKAASISAAVLAAIVLAFLFFPRAPREVAGPPEGPPAPAAGTEPGFGDRGEIAASEAEGKAAPLADPLPVVMEVFQAKETEEDAIAGTVTDARTGEPIAGAVVQVEAFPGPGPEAVTDESGAYSIPEPGTGHMTLVAWADGHEELPAEVSRPAPGRSVQDFALDPAVAVIVTVLDEGGAPIAGASVTPSAPKAEGLFRGEDTVLTDAAGKAWLPAMSALRPRRLHIQKEGFAAADPRLELEPGKDPLEVKVVLARETIQVKMIQARAIIGRVTEPGGRPIAGAVIEWKDGSGTAFGDGVEYGQFKAVSGRDGIYRLEFPDKNDSCHLAAAAKGRAPVIRRDVKPGTPGQPAVEDFVLEPGHWLAGRVVGEDGKPLPGTTVRVMAARDLLHEGVAYPAALRETKADAEGRFRLEDLPGPKAAIRLQRARGDDRPEQDEEIEVDREVELVHCGWGAFRGRVVDAETGEPVSRFNIKILGTVLARLAEVGQTFTAADGRFALTELWPAERFGIVVRADGYAPLEMNDLRPAAAGKAEEVRIDLPRGRPLEGTVVDGLTGAPLSDALLLLTEEKGIARFLARSPDLTGMDIQAQRAVTAADGAFRFLEGTPHTLVVRAKGRRRLIIQPEGRSSFARAGGGLRIPLEAGDVLTVTCFRDGRPARGERVCLYPPGAEGDDMRAIAIAETRYDGTCSWDELAPGPYVVETVRGSDGFAGRDFQVYVRRRIELAGKPEAVELGKDMGGAGLHGRLGMDGHETFFARLFLRPPSGDGEEIAMTAKEDSGWKYSCPFLHPGNYAVEVEFWAKGGTRKVSLGTIEVLGDTERDFAVPAP